MAPTKDALAQALHSLRDTEQAALPALIELVDRLRPNQASNRLLANARVNQLCDALEQDAQLAQALRRHLLELLTQRRLTSFFCDSGILPNSGFFTELWRRMVQRVLPPISDDSYLKDCLRLVFHKHADHIWLDSLDHELKQRLVRALRLDALEQQPALVEMHAQMLDAADILAARIAAMGLEPELARVYPRMEERDSPFLALAREAHQLSTGYREQLLQGQPPDVDEAHLLVLVDQCRDMLTRVQSRAASIGTSLPLSYLLRRLTQSLRRLELLVLILQSHVPTAQQDAQPQDREALWLELLDEAIPGEGRRHSVRVHLDRSTGLLAQRVTENASRTGEHYITSSRDEYFAMWRAAMGAGFIVGFMALVKLYMGKLALAPLGYALAYSLNYAGGFVLVHVLHFTIATKQPAMTAATIAGAVSSIRASVRDLEKLATLVVDLVRSQLAAILGNVGIALPTAMAIAWLLSHALGGPFIDAAKARHLLHDISPFESLALLHAAIAGVCLFLAGLVSGYYDNLAAYERVRERILHVRWLRAWLGEARQQRFAAYAHDNLGALAGNVFFGFSLGTMPMLGLLTGLPLDIRHVTFASANFGFALVALDFAVDGWTVLKSLAGIGLVGLVNLTVSFALALWLALRARGAGFSQTSALLGILAQRWRANRRQFFWPAA